MFSGKPTNTAGFTESRKGVSPETVSGEDRGRIYQLLSSVDQNPAQARDGGTCL
jgi:hypothetical protein